MKKFLQTFTANTETNLPNAINKGANNLIPIVIEHELETQLLSTDTTTLKPAASVDWDYAPILLEVYTPSTTGTRTSKKSLVSITSFNKTTGVITFTASGTVPVGSNFLIMLVPASNTNGT